MSAESDATIRLLEEENVRLRMDLDSARLTINCMKPRKTSVDATRFKWALATRDDLIVEVNRLETLLEDRDSQLGASTFIASERTRNSICRWLRDTFREPWLPSSVPSEIAKRVEACEDIAPP